MIEAGHYEPLGATCRDGGVNFALYSGAAEAVELCLFDATGRETQSLRMPGHTDGVWHAFVPRCGPGQLYGFRVHGRYAPEEGLRFNSSKLVIDPYARELRGDLVWRPEVFDFARLEPTRGLIPAHRDSAPFVPKSVVHGPGMPATRRPGVPWAETIIYEANVRGYTMLHPAVAEADRGTFRGMRQREVLAWLKALGITSVELLPVHFFVDEEFLVARGLRNFWGYNTLGFFAPAQRLLGGGGIYEFREMVDAIHDAGLEVILDVVYNHTAEGGRLGPTLSFRGIDNRAYYRLLPENPGEYVNDTGVGNTINTDHAIVRRLIVDSLRYWATVMGVDGFRFDLAATLGRHETGFDAAHPLFAEIEAAPELAGAKLIAEPWDVGPGGYRLGGFPAPWAEWNDRFRDAARRFWRGDAGLAPELARRLHGSSDLFEPGGRGPWASINYVASHDGFTLLDAVSYVERHNEANGENNRDGHRENFSVNHGVEGATAVPELLAARRRHRLSLLLTLFCAQGTPMLLAGDELGNSQLGNNNAYAQDNPIGWVDWDAAGADPQFAAAVRALIRLRRTVPLLRQARYRHGNGSGDPGEPDIAWLRPDGQRPTEADWHSTRAVGLLLTGSGAWRTSDGGAVVLIFNAGAGPVRFRLPDVGGAGQWCVEFASGGLPGGAVAAAEAELEAGTAACLVLRMPPA